MVHVEEGDAEFVEKKGVCGTKDVGCVEIFLREGHVAELEVLHSEEELGEMGALEESCGGAVCGNGLIVFTFCGEGMCKADPRGAEVRIHDRGFGEESTCFGDLVDGEVVDCNSEPGGGFLGMGICKLVGKEEEGVGIVELVKTSEMEREGLKIVRIRG